MNSVLLNKKKYWVAISVLLFSLSSIFANAATFENKKTLQYDSFNLNEDLSYFEGMKHRKEKAIEEVKYNYQFVLELGKLKKYKEAALKVKTLIQRNPKQSIYYNLKAALQLTDKNLVGAEQSFLRAVELNARNSQAFLGLAKLALDNKQFDQAGKFANRVLEIDSHETKAYQILANVVMQQQGVDAVETLLLGAHVKVKHSLKAELAILQLLNKVYMTKQQHGKLLQLATDIVARNKKAIPALAYLAEVQLINKDAAGAEQTLRQIVARQPQDANYLFLLAKLLGEKKGAEAEILSILDKAVGNHDNLALVLSYKVAVLIKQKKLRQALAVAKQVDEEAPGLSLGKIVLADVYFAENKNKAALQNYLLAYQITPNIKVLDAILNIFVLQNKPKEAVEFLLKELEKNSGSTAIQYRLAVTYQYSGQHDLAIKYYEALLARQKDNVSALNNLAWIYSQRNDSKAIKLAAQAFRLAPKSGAVADTYGYILLKNEKKQESITVLRQAVKLLPDSIEIQLHLAEAYIANQNKLLAKKILQRLLSKKSGKREEIRKVMDKL